MVLTAKGKDEHAHNKSIQEVTGAQMRVDRELELEKEAHTQIIRKLKDEEEAHARTVQESKEEEGKEKLTTLGMDLRDEYKELNSQRQLTWKRLWEKAVQETADLDERFKHKISGN